MNNNKSDLIVTSPIKIERNSSWDDTINSLLITYQRSDAFSEFDSIS